MRSALLVAGGAMIGWGAAYISLEARFRKKYEERQEALERAFQRVDFHQKITEPPAKSEDELNNPDLVVNKTFEQMVEAANFEAPGDETIMVTDIQEISNDYRKAYYAKETDTDLFVAGGVNDYGVSYIEEEEYFDEDGRPKYQIQMILDSTGDPIFILDGQQIDDWDQRVGDSIVVDFYKLVPPGVDPILYVRNHKTGEDYEVVRVEP